MQVEIPSHNHLQLVTLRQLQNFKVSLMGLQIHMNHCEQSYKACEKVEQEERNGNMKIGREERGRTRWIRQRENGRRNYPQEAMTIT